jgi:hypothetical protein
MAIPTADTGPYNGPNGLGPSTKLRGESNPGGGMILSMVAEPLVGEQILNLKG